MDHYFLSKTKIRKVKIMKAILFNKNLGKVALAFVLAGLCMQSVQAQYFGRNKPQYQSFDFEVMETPHFEIYHYLEDDSTLNNLGIQTERWYKRHQLVLQDTFKQKNPLIMYNNHADFQQTGVVSGLISVGTGGVTEGLKNRVVMPFLQTAGQTDHVLGHELVHAFQFHMLTQGDSTNLTSIRRLPLWMVEGMAEYLSIGRKDAHTAMWMRDAIISDDFPTLKDLTRNSKYFPYRYGQAFWAFTAGIYGDTIVQPLFVETAKLGYEGAIKKMTGLDAEAYGKLWKDRMEDAYKPLMEDTIATIGNVMFNEENAGNMNLSPVYSNDGKYVAFLSEKDVLSIDLFLANAETGEIIRKLSTGSQKFHIDDYSYIETAGTFSPDNSRFAFVAFSKGKNILLVAETYKGKILEEIEIPGLSSFTDPAWSPDGKYIAVSGLKNGQTDLYLYDYIQRDVIQLTNDRYSEIQPSWSADGQKIVFSSDRGADTNLKELEFGSYKISVMDLNNKELKVHDFFPKADNLNPYFGDDENKIYFISNADGFRNLYEFDTESRETYKLTKYFTGISGITEYSPAISVAKETGEIAYSIFRRGEYTIHKAKLADFPRFAVNPDSVDFRASILPPMDNISTKAYRMDPPERKVSLGDSVTFADKEYKSKFNLSYISNSQGFGVGTSAMGTGFAGGVNMLFSDMLNNHQLFAGLSLNGEIYDFGGQVMYLNRKNRFNWGVGISHIPYLTGALSIAKDTLNLEGEPTEVDKLSFLRRRIFEDQVTLFSQIPFSITQRLEGGLSFSRYSYRVDEINSYYYGGFQIGQDRNKLDAPEGFNVGRGYLAFVGDNSRFGLTAPLMGQRYRFQVEKLVGEIDYYGFLADYRKYVYLNPVSFAFRGMHYGRYGGNSEALYPLVLGSDYLVRGYNINDMNTQPTEGGVSIDQLIGSRMAVFNAEMRIPFTGPERLSMIKSKFLFSDLAFFVDGGMVWSQGNDLEFSWKPTSTAQTPIFSAGVAMRVNLFGYMILEPYYAFPFQRNDKTGTFGLTLSTGGW